MSQTTPQEYDVIIVGGGPGGSTTGAFLARGGQRVLILEKETFPRFHVGESLLPYGNQVLQASGAWPRVEAAGFLVKHGAEFALGNGSRLNRLWFREGLDPAHTFTYQVDRARFDHLLLQHAAACGCEVRENTACSRVREDADGVTLTAGETEIRARWLVDASGRDTVAGRQLGFAREPLEIPKRIAVYAHFENVSRHDGEAAGHITIIRLAEGWFWLIPLANGRTSVGMVQRLATFDKSNETVEDWFTRTVAASTELRARMKDAVPVTPFHTTSDYSYRFRELARPRVLLVGDAAGFIDPIFSSGVTIATRSGQLAAASILAAENQQRPLHAAEQKRYTREVRRWMDIYLQLIRIYYDPRGFEVFMQPKDRFRLVQTVNSLLAGNTSRRPSIRWRVGLFNLLCALQRWVPIVPRLDLAEAHD